MQYAGFLRRLVAYIVDAVLLYSIFFVLALLLGDSGMDPQTGAINPVLDLLALLISWLYFALMESSARQATLGKMAIGIKVTDLEGNPIAFPQATGRFFGKILSTLLLLIGYIMVAFTEKKQGLHDILAKTLVLMK